ncbi:MAG TPA: ABC transporter ATP-binding protein [Thermotoga sp.]|uniref:ABC transporter ATP-binding protein n=1 Tax=Thermotoga TaxID=2335 RepID=UPI0001600BB1|nr:ABC transporter ATP-binding protein [Thermotoga sp. RQ2]ACB09958.1 oligopeptide/dipeptide ABC transporter, ATPase subunit [Thermotoga sp. RQ2]HBF69314.1 ABC transporter ATP-binding protein [Thermotoga sp.]
MEDILILKNLTKVYSIGSLLFRSKITAVDGVSFSLKRAEIFTLAGESGCGKSTTAKMILGFEEPTSGDIIFEGNSIQWWKKRKKDFLRKVQAVFQNPFESFNPLLTVDDIFFETVMNYGLANSRNEAEKLIDEKLQLVGLKFEDINGRYQSELSGGQLQRASIARSLLSNPSLLIADEPVSMVDASLRMSIVNLFAKLRDQLGVSVIYITHDLATAYYVSDRIAIMFRGNIVETGPVDKVLIDPKHPYTQLLCESIPDPDPEKKWSREITVSDTEYEEYLKEGCRFAGRCPYVKEICRHEKPDDVLVDGVLVKCHIYKK